MLYENITATNTDGFGTLAFQQGTGLFRLSGDFDGETATMQYTEDGGTTWRSVGVASLVGVTTDMTAAVALIVGRGVNFRISLTTGGGSPDLDLFYAPSASAS